MLSLADGDIAVELSAILDMLSGSMLAVSVSARGIWAQGRVLTNSALWV